METRQPLPPPPDYPAHQTPDFTPPNQQPIPNAQAQQQNNLDLPNLVMVACLVLAAQIAAHSIHTVHPLYSHSLRLMALLAVSSILVAKFIAPKLPKAGSVLYILGDFFVATAFFLAVTIPLSLCLRIISWIIYALSLLAILICNCP